MNARPSDIHEGGMMAALPRALDPLVAEHRWLVWRWETNDQGKRTKVPYRARQPGVKASSTNPATWSDYATAVDAVYAGKADGIGFTLHESDFAAFDIDDCRNPETGAIEPWAQNLIDQADSYAEVTVSGTGVRIIGRSEGGYVHRNQAYPGTSGRVETYLRASRYIVVSGAELNWAGLRNIDRV